MKKDVVVIILILFVVGLAAYCVRMGEKERKAVKNLEEERYGRMVAEESLQKNAAKLATLSAQLKSTTDKMAKIQDIVDQQKTVNSDLKKQYAKLAEAKEDLEGKLKSTIQESAQPAPAAAATPTQ